MTLWRLGTPSTSILLPPLFLAPLAATSTPITSTPIPSPTTSFLPTLAHERATSPLFRASAFAFRSFSVFILIFSAFAPSGNRRHHLHRISDSRLSQRGLSIKSTGSQHEVASMRCPAKSCCSTRSVRGFGNLCIAYCSRPRGKIP